MDIEEKVAPDMTDSADHIGARLKAAREAMGKSQGDISAQIKVPVRMLDIVERGAVTELPAGPYAVGFVRSYAQAVGLDVSESVAEMRAMLSAQNIGTVTATTYYEPANIDRVPSRALAWTTAGIAGLLVIGYLVWRSFVMTPDGADTPSAAQVEVGAATPADPAVVAASPAPTVTIAADAPVLISATDNVWFSLENAAGRSQFDLTLEGGEFYTVRPGQRGLFLRTGKPQSLKLVVGGQALPSLGAPDTIVSGIGLDAASLSRLASGQSAAAPAAPATTAPATGR